MFHCFLQKLRGSLPSPAYWPWRNEEAGAAPHCGVTTVKVRFIADLTDRHFNTRKYDTQSESSCRLVLLSRPRFFLPARPPSSQEEAGGSGRACSALPEGSPLPREHQVPLI